MRFRAAGLDDVQPCIELLRSDGQFRSSDAVWAALPSLCRQGLADGSLIVQLFEAESPVGSPVLAGLRISAFIDPGFVSNFSRAPHRYVAARIWEDVMAGKSPILDRARVADENALGQLHLGVLHWCTRSRNPLSPETLAVLAMVPSAWQIAHGGYHLQSIAFYEVYGKVPAAIMRKIGYKSYGKLAESTSTSDTSGPMLNPVCFYAQKEDAALGSGALMALAMFHAPAPRFGLAPAQQRVTLAALDGISDKQIAASLGVSYETVRKTWDAVYQRVGDIEPALLPQGTVEGAHRGVEKRRVLLEYLRQHMEELRPFNKRLSGTVRSSPDNS